VYSGIKIIALPEEVEADPRDSWAARCFIYVVPLHEGYAEEPSFFIWPAAGDKFRSSGPTELELAAAGLHHTDNSPRSSPHLVVESSSYPSWTWKWLGMKATMLLVVVLTVIAVDLVFAVDSVTAKVAMVSQYDESIDLVLNFTSSAFTMLTLRSLYFVIASLVHLFRFMKSGVALVLVLIGARLMFSSYVEVGEAVFCLVIVAIFAASMLASVLLGRGKQEVFLQVKGLEEP